MRNLSSNKFHLLQDTAHHHGCRSLQERDMANQAVTFLAQSHHWISNQKKGIGLDNHTNGILGSTNRNVAQAMEFSDATSSDWSLFTSSDEASFSTESRDSFSTVDYTETCNADTLSSIFNNLYPPQSSSQNTFCCRTFSSSRPQTKFISDLEESGYVLDSFLSTHSTKGLWRGNSSKRVSNSTEFPTLLL